MTDPTTLPSPSRRRIVAIGAGAALTLAGVGSVAAQEGEASPDPRLVQETVTFQMRKQVFKGLLVRLRGSAKRPGLLLIPDQRGPTPAFRAFARRFALDGFVVLLPDLVAPFGVPENSEEAETAMTRLGPADAQLALDTAAELLAKHPECNGSIGAMGLAWGGVHALQFAITGARVKAVVALYAVPPQPERLADAKVPIAFHWPENDIRTAPAAETIEKRLIAGGRVFESWIYPDTQVGFASDPSSRRWNRDAAGRAFDRAVVFFKRWLA